MKNCLISDVGISLPKKIMKNEEISKFLDTSDEWIISRTGISERRVAIEESTYSMAYDSVKNIKHENIRLIVTATSTPDMSFPSCSSYVHGKMGLPKNVTCFDVHDACNGFIQSFITAMLYLESLPLGSQALIIGSEKMTKIVDWKDRSTAILFGDGAGAVLLDNRYGKCINWSSNSYASLESLKSIDKIEMNGQEVFKNAVKCISEDVINVSNGDEIDLFIPHQANTRIINKVADNIGLDKEKLVYNGNMYGNTSAASVPIALYDAYSQNRLKANQKIMFSGFGAGFRWGSIFVQN